MRRATLDEQTRNRRDFEIAEVRAEISRIDVQIAEVDAASQVRGVESVERAATSERIREIRQRIEPHEARLREIHRRIR